ncbi:MAG: hypothetical protein EOP54_09240 [Sphingobacteriales bacterium]|nr:MAG: hypothetical protein EOP54_09240 [Sphingobacteriales bacterium]
MLMRKVIFAGLLLLGLSKASTAHARLKIPFGEREVIEKVADLPDTEEYAADSGGKRFIDLGRLHHEYNIAWILPLNVTQAPKLVGMVAGEANTYYELSGEQINEIVKANNLDTEKLLSLGFYTRFGGKIVAGILVLLIIYGFIPSRKKAVTPETV